MANEPIQDDYARGGAPEFAPDAVVPAERPDLDVVEPRPPVDPTVSTYVSYWWDSTAETPEFRDARQQFIADQHDLFPFDERRKRRNGQQNEKAGVRSKADARIVQNPHLYRAAQRAVAMTIPDGHTRELKARKPIPSMTQQQKPLGARQQDVQFAKTGTALLDHYLGEIHWQDIGEDWVRDGSMFRVGLLKGWWQSDYMTDPLSTNRLSDMQDELAELQSLLSDFRRGRFDQNDGRFTRMLDMQMAIQEKTQLNIWEGICAETVSMDRFRIDPRIRSVDSFYSAKWMSEDLVMAKRDVLARFPFKLDPEDPKGFVGVHPDDLSKASYYDNGGDIVRSREAERREIDRDTRQSRMTSEQTSYDSLDDDDVLFLVRQIFVRDEGKILVLINGLEYPAAEWEPQNTWSNWYPFFPIVINRQHGTWYGRSDTELASDEQARINQKQTDAEKIREMMIPRGIFNKAAVDEQEIIKISEIRGGEIRGLFIPRGNLGENFEWLTLGNVNPDFLNTQENMMMLDKMVGFSEAFMGTMGQAEFATEVAVMAQGTNIMIRQRQAVVRRALERFYTAMFEIMLQTLDPETVKRTVGPNAFWPEMSTDQEAARQQAELRNAAIAQVRDEIAMVKADPQPMLAARQFPGIENPAMRAQTVYEEMAQEVWGGLEPMTRDSLFKRCWIKVKNNPNGMLDRQEKLGKAMELINTLAGTGSMPARKVVASIISELLEMDDEVDDLIEIDPIAAVQEMVQAFMESGDQLPPEALQQLATIGGVAQQLLLQASMQEGREVADQSARAAVMATEEGGEEGGPSGVPPGEAAAGQPGEQVSQGGAEAAPVEAAAAGGGPLQTTVG